MPAKKNNPGKGFGVGPKKFKKMTGTTQKKAGMSFEDALKKYGNDVTKIPGWSGRGMDGKVKPKTKKKK